MGKDHCQLHQGLLHPHQPHPAHRVRRTPIRAEGKRRIQDIYCHWRWEHLCFKSPCCEKTHLDDLAVIFLIRFSLSGGRGDKRNTIQSVHMDNQEMKFCHHFPQSVRHLRCNGVLVS